MVKMKYPIKEEEDQITFNKGPQFLLKRKGEPEKQSPRVLQFLTKDTTT